MTTETQEFFHDFRQELVAGSETSGQFQLSEFVDVVTGEIIDAGMVDGFEHCHYRAQRGMRVDGYWFNEEGVLDLFVADFDSRTALESLTRTEMKSCFKRVQNFLDASINRDIASQLEITSPAYGLAKDIQDRIDSIRRINLFLLSERLLSDRVKDIDSQEIAGASVMHQVWDIGRLHRLRSSRGRKEALELDFVETFGQGIACLSADVSSAAYGSYLVVMPAGILADLYEEYGARLLEQNVRTFLQARGKVNKGIRTTIMNEPDMFFAYNNGITATAEKVETEATQAGLMLTRIKDLQIVNGGQTTASLFHTRRRDNVDLSHVFVQMKLSVIESDESEQVVPRISEYANTQNRVSAADFFSNHPYHIRMEEFSRRLWAPATDGAQHETRWFYERARGQYADAQATLTPAQKKRFRAEHPKAQMFSKTDLAKFENVWDEHPKWVNMGAQKNFGQYAKRIGSMWESNSDQFNELYFKTIVARGIIYRRTEKLVSEQSWYAGGYRANIVIYTLAAIAEAVRGMKKHVDIKRIWECQKLSAAFETAITRVARLVNDVIVSPPHGISNISEWAKKDACWDRIEGRLSEITDLFPEDFTDELVSDSQVTARKRSAKKVQKIDNGIEAQRMIVSISGERWITLHRILKERELISSKEDGVLRVASSIPSKIPTEKQSLVLLETLKKAAENGIAIP